MSPKLLELHIAQLSKTIEKSKTNRYSDSRKQNYHETLSLLFNKIIVEDISKLSYNDQLNLKKIIDFAFISFEFLDNSILTITPYEIVYCLEKALNEWDDTNNYVIVTTLNNNIDGYSFNPNLSLTTTYYDLIKAKYNLDFEHRFIQISLPKYLVHDYLANVVLYHELGHFIDMKFKISESIILQKLALGAISKDQAQTKYNYYSEFFSDIFASQYIGDSSNQYLNYIAHKDKDSKTHPSTDKRVELVDQFINNNFADQVLNDLSIAVKAITKKDLIKRYTPIKLDDFTDFIPTILKNDQELHSIFKAGWDLWLDEVQTFKDKGISYEEKYRILNNLIEKSISNYMVLENWK